MNLKEYKHLCILPWLHARVDPNGDVLPCCRSSYDFIYGNLKKNDFEFVLNDAMACELRQSMLADLTHPACSDCYRLEKLGVKSLRQEANNDFKEFADVLKQTRPDGSLPEVRTRFLDIRFSNICNFRCRTCNADSSSAWAAEMKKVDPTSNKGPMSTPENLWKFIDQMIPSLKRVYFAGGEPLLEEDHYLFLEKAIAAKRSDLELIYNTNFSSFRFKNWNVFEIWHQFPKVHLALSFDGVNAQGEYIRKGMNWPKIEENFHMLTHVAPNVDYYAFPTISVLNAFHITTAIQKWIDMGLLRKPSHLQFNILNNPDYLNLNVFNDAERTRLRAHYANFLNTLHSGISSDVFFRIKKELTAVLNFIDIEPRKATFAQARKSFRQVTNHLDRIRAENLVDIFPELSSLMTES